MRFLSKKHLLGTTALIALVTHGAMAAYPITDEILQKRIWKLFGGLATTDASPLTNYSSAGGSLDFVDLKVDLTIANAAAPTLGTTFTSLGSCRSDTQYEFAAAFYNASGHTAGVSFLTWSPSSGNSNKATIIMPAAPATATAWSCIFARSSDNPAFSIWRGCAAPSPTANDILPVSTASQISSCGSTGTVFSNTNTTGIATIASLYDGQWRLPSVSGNPDADDPRQTPGLRRVSLPPIPISSTGTWTLSALELADVATALKGFGAGLYAAAGQKVCFDGSACQTYAIYDGQQVSVFVAGNAGARVGATGLSPGDCVDRYRMSAGEQCYDGAAQRTWIRDDRGVHQVGQ